jgi:hypothetical protein
MKKLGFTLLALAAVFATTEVVKAGTFDISYTGTMPALGNTWDLEMTVTSSANGGGIYTITAIDDYSFVAKYANGTDYVDDTSATLGSAFWASADEEIYTGSVLYNLVDPGNGINAYGSVDRWGLSFTVDTGTSAPSAWTFVFGEGTTITGTTEGPITAMYTLADNAGLGFADGSLTITDESTASAPEPASIALLGAGLLGLATVLKRRAARSIPVRLR